MERDSIENIFRKGLENYKIEPEEEEWTALNLTLPRLNFFKFSFYTFNIYYCSLIVLCFLFSTFSLLFTLSGKYSRSERFVERSERKENSNNPLLNKSELTSTIQIEEEKEAEATRKLPELEKNEEKISKTKVLSKNTNNTESTPVSSKRTKEPLVNGEDNLLKLERSETTEITQGEQPMELNKKKKRVVYITRQDTIVVIDTLRRPKRKN
jgi:hypothetical protein